MNRVQRIRRQAMSLRGGIAVGGALAIAVSLTQVAGTLAATGLERTAKAPIATANYYPTPLTSSVTCETKPTPNLVNYTARRAEISWTAVPGATGYRMELVDYDNGTIWKTQDVGASVTTIGGITAVGPGRNVLYARIRTLNGPAVSSGYRSANSGMSFKDYASDRTECEKAAKPSLLNQGWENNQSWSPEVESFGIGQPLVNALRGVAAEADGIDDEMVAVATLDDAVAETSKAEAPEARTAEATTIATSTPTSATRMSSSTAPTTAPAGRPTTSSSSTSAPSSPTATSASPSTTRATSSTTATSTALSTTRGTTTSTTLPATSTSATAATTATPVALPGGGEAKLVGGTILVVSDDDGPVCSATVREGSTLKVRSGVLEVTDARETREVDPQTCELS